MIYTFVYSPLSYLQWLEKEYGWKGEAPVDESSWEEEAPVLNLKLELRFLRPYLVYLSMAKVNPFGSGFTPLINDVAAALRDLTKDLSLTCRGSPTEVGAVVSSMLEKVKGCKGEIKEAYTVLWDQAWKSITSLNALPVMEFIDSIQVNLRDLLRWKNFVSDMKINIESLGEKLSYIADFIGITYQQKMGPYLTNVQVFAASATCLSYFCWFDEIDDTLPDKIARWFDEVDETLPKMMSPVMQEISREKHQSTDDPPEEKKKDQRMISLTYSVHANKLTEYLTMKVNDALLPLLKKVEVIRVYMYAKKQQKHRDNLLYPLKDQIKRLQEDIKNIEPDFRLRNCSQHALKMVEHLMFTAIHWENLALQNLVYHLLEITLNMKYSHSSMGRALHGQTLLVYYMRKHMRSPPAATSDRFIKWGVGNGVVSVYPHLLAFDWGIEAAKKKRSISLKRRDQLKRQMSRN